MKMYSKVIASSFAKVGTQTIGKSLKGLKCKHAQSIIRMEPMIKQPNQLLMCGIRNFVDRNMSYFFQTCCDDVFNDVRCSSNDFKGEYCFIGSRDVVLKKTTEELIALFKNSKLHDTPTAWFHDFFNMVDFDYKNQTFDKELGYQLYTLKNGNDLMLYRLDSLNDLIEKSPLFKGIVNDNIGNKKWYKEKYKDFKDEIIFDKKYLENQLNNDIMNFFYTEEEIKSFKNKYRV